MADAADLKSVAERREGSNPSTPTNYIRIKSVPTTANMSVKWPVRY